MSQSIVEQIPKTIPCPVCDGTNSHTPGCIGNLDPTLCKVIGCQSPADPLIAAMLDIARTPMMLYRGTCDATADCDRGGKGNGYRCGDETVVCPCCHRDAGFCAEHLIEDEEFHPELPGVCGDCFLTPVAECDVLAVAS